MGYKYLRIIQAPDLDSSKKARRVDSAEKHSKDSRWERTFLLDDSTFRAYSKGSLAINWRIRESPKGSSRAPLRSASLDWSAPEGPAVS